MKLLYAKIKCWCVMQGPGIFNVAKFTQILKIDSSKSRPLTVLTDDPIQKHDDVYLLTADGEGSYVQPVDYSKTPCFRLHEYKLIDGEIPDTRPVFKCPEWFRPPQPQVDGYKPVLQLRGTK